MDADHTLAPFPPGFLIGASTAAHQIEGGNVNSTWWGFEHAEGSPVAEPSGDAADSYHRWRDDIDVLAAVGLGAYRFSVEWARVEPEPGLVSRAALAHYRRIVDGLLERGIEPVVTLHHFTEPRWFGRAGGWADADGAVDRFVAYVEALRPVLEGVRWVVTINEPNMVAIMAAVVRGVAGKDVATDDLGPLPLPDAATQRVLVEAHQRLESSGGVLRLVDASPAVRRLLQISGIDGYLRVD